MKNSSLVRRRSWPVIRFSWPTRPGSALIVFIVVCLMLRRTMPEAEIVVLLVFGPTLMRWIFENAPPRALFAINIGTPPDETLKTLPEHQTERAKSEERRIGRAVRREIEACVDDKAAQREWARRFSKICPALAAPLFVRRSRKRKRERRKKRET